MQELTIAIPDTALWTLLNGLRAAAERYREHAILLRDLDRQKPAPHYVDLAEQFEKQALEVTQVADHIEENA